MLEDLDYVLEQIKLGANGYDTQVLLMLKQQDSRAVYLLKITTNNYVVFGDQVPSKKSFRTPTSISRVVAQGPIHKNTPCWLEPILAVVKLGGHKPPVYITLDENYCPLTIL